MTYWYTFLKKMIVQCNYVSSYQSHNCCHPTLECARVYLVRLRKSHINRMSSPKSHITGTSFVQFLGSRDGAVVIALASHQCGPGSNPGPDVISGLSLLLVLVLAPRAFLRVLPFSSPHKNQHF